MQASDFAWQPLTPGGVAAFARCRPLHVLVLQLVMALLAAFTLAWFISTAWFPVIAAAIQKLPEGAAVQGRKLAWPEQSPVVLSQNHFLGLAVDLRHEGQARSPAHVNIEFGSEDIRIFSLFGLVEARYPQGWRIAFSRSELIPWWGAWSPAILALAMLGTIAWLFINWWILAAVYTPIAWLVAFFADRDLRLRPAWRLCGAALMPGALALLVAILLYGCGVLDVVRLLAGAAVHFVIGWVYVVVAPFWCPRHPAAAQPKGNPFSTPAKDAQTPN